MQEITQIHLDFVKELTCKEVKNGNLDGAQILLDISKYFTSIKKETPNEPIAPISLCTLEQSFTENNIITEMQTPTLKQEKSTSTESQCPPEKKKTPFKIIKTVGRVTFKHEHDVSKLEFIKKLTPDEIEGVRYFADNNMDIVKNFFREISHPISKYYTCVDFIMSIIECEPSFHCDFDENGNLVVCIMFYPKFLNDVSYKMTRTVGGLDRSFKFNSKTKEIECSGLNFKKLKDETTHDLVELCFESVPVSVKQN